MASGAFEVDGLFAIVWVLMATIALSMVIERGRFGRYLPGPMLVLIIPCALANAGLMPSQSPVYDTITDFAIPVGVTLLLLRANIGEIVRSSGKMLPLYLLAGVGVLISIVIVGQIMQFDDKAGLWAMLAALWIGSVLNVMATAQAIQANETLVAGVIAANALIAPAYLALMMILMQSRLFGRLVGVVPGSSRGEFSPPPDAPETPQPAGPPPPLGALIAILYALGVFIAVDYLASLAGLENYSILFVTVVAVTVPNLMPGIRRVMSGAREIGMICMFLFIAVISAQIDLGALGYFSLRIVVFMVLALGLNLVFLIGIGRLFKSDPHVLLLASQAGVGGATSTAAIAAASGREDLVTPGILCSLLGVVLSTFVGVLIYQLLGG